WLKLFGFHLDDIARAQTRISNDQTTILDSSYHDPSLYVPWFHARRVSVNFSTVVPLVQILQSAPAIPASRLLRAWDTVLYIKIGSEDAVSFPELTPGSIVRVRKAEDSLQPAWLPGTTLSRLHLVEFGTTPFCCRLCRLPNGGVGTISTHLPCPTVEL